jgi:CRISPR-associated protein Cas1
MNLVLNTYGTSLKVKEGMFHIRIPITEEKILSQKPDSSEIEGSEKIKYFQLSPQKIEVIVVSNHIFLSSDVIRLAMEHNIDMVFLDTYGHPFSRVWHCRMGSTATIRKRQLEVSQTAEGLNIVLDGTIRKIINQKEFIEKLLRARREKADDYVDSLKTLQQMIERLESLRKLDSNLEEKRNEIMGLEGTSGRVYFQSISKLLPERWQFQGRSRNPAKDPFNCLLNYAYGVLYSKVEKACIIAGLDPYIGFLHTDNYGKPSLVFDLIEPYRIWADICVFYLFSGRQVKMEFMDEIPGGLTLNKEGKSLLMQAFNDDLEKTQRYRNRNIKTRDIIQYDLHRLANTLLGKKSDEIDWEVEEL